MEQQITVRCEQLIDGYVVNEIGLSTIQHRLSIYVMADCYLKARSPIRRTKMLVRNIESTLIG